MRQISVFSLLLAVGCTCGGPTNTHDLYLAQVGELCSLYARCGYIGRSQEQKCYQDGQAYYEQYSSALQSYDADAAIRAGRLSLDTGTANYCLGLLRKSSCNSGSIFLSYSSACATVYKGRVPPGSACQNALECANGSCSFASVGGSTCNGVCAAYAAEGASCATTQCDRTRNFCDASRICRPRGNIGAACRGQFSYDECIEGLGCTSAGVCARPGSGGEPCAGGLCSPGFHCVSGGATGVCAANVRHGESCPDPAACPDGDRCVGTPGAPGICTTVLDVGDACDPARDACPASAPCAMDTRRCTTPMTFTEGASCTTSCYASSAYGLFTPALYCDRLTSTCKRKLKPAETCTRPSTGGEDPCLTTCSVSTGTGTCNPPPPSCF